MWLRVVEVNVRWLGGAPVGQVRTQASQPARHLFSAYGTRSVAVYFIFSAVTSFNYIIINCLRIEMELK